MGHFLLTILGLLVFCILDYFCFKLAIKRNIVSFYLLHEDRIEKEIEKYEEKMGSDVPDYWDI